MTLSPASADQMPVFGLGAGKAFHAPLGAASPLWFAYASAASAGLAYWWMTRWMRPFNIEALFEAPEPLQIPIKAAEPVSAPLVVEAETTAIEPMAELAPEPEPVAEAAVVEAEPAPVQTTVESPAPPPVVEPAPVKATPVKASPAKASAKSAEAAPRTAASGKPTAKSSPARRG